MKNKVLTVVGMHRSMTSLSMQWLQACGLPIGDDLYGATKGNAKGHYEDKDFLEINHLILSQNGYSWNDNHINHLEIPEYAKQKAKKIVELKNELYHEWGWKDPRTCLLLDFWNQIIPEARYLIIYRPFEEVVDSLLRRKIKSENKLNYIRKAYKKMSVLKNLNGLKKSHLKLWINYNKKILQDIKKIDPERYVIINSYSLIESSGEILSHLTGNWGFDLKQVPMRKIFDPELKNPTFFSLSGVDKNLLQEAESIQDQFDNISFLN